MNDGVVVGYDQSHSAERTLAEAARAALRRNEPLVVLNAYPEPTPHGATLPLPETSDWAPTDLVDSANRLVGHGITLIRSWFPQLPVEGRVVAGRAWEVLDEASHHATLLVVGSRGGVTDTLPGSVTPRVLADSACPVLVVPNGHGNGHGSSRGTGRHGQEAPMVAGVDIDGPCDDVLDFALAEAGRRKSALEVVHVWEEPWNLTYLRHTTGLGQEIKRIEQQRSTRLAELLDKKDGGRHGVHPVGRVESGSAAKTLVATTRSAALMVVGARPQGPGHRHRLWIGPVVHALLHHAECPVAVVPNGPSPT